MVCGLPIFFPLAFAVSMLLFTLARIERIGGKEYAVFSFDKNNEPIFGKK